MIKWRSNCISTGDEPKIIELIENGADLNLKDGDERIPLHFAALRGIWKFEIRWDHIYEMKSNFFSLFHRKIALHHKNSIVKRRKVFLFLSRQLSPFQFQTCFFCRFWQNCEVNSGERQCQSSAYQRQVGWDCFELGNLLWFVIFCFFVDLWSFCTFRFIWNTLNVVENDETNWIFCRQREGHRTSHIIWLRHAQQKQ